jgi:hypothetical protein
MTPDIVGLGSLSKLCQKIFRADFGLPRLL